MTIIYVQDALNSIIHDSVTFKGARVLDVGCGDGEDTLSYAADTKETIGIDPDTELIENARQDTPESLRYKVKFITTTIEDFVSPNPSHQFDIAYFGWSL